MLMNREQLALNLAYLAKEDYELLNDIIADYVMNKIDNKRLNDLEDYVNTELSAILWGLHHYYSMLRGVA